MLSWLMFITPILWPTGVSAENANEELSRRQVQEAFGAPTQTVIILHKHNSPGINPAKPDSKDSFFYCHFHSFKKRN